MFRAAVNECAGFWGHGQFGHEDVRCFEPIAADGGAGFDFYDGYIRTRFDQLVHLNAFSIVPEEEVASLATVVTVFQRFDDDQISKKISPQWMAIDMVFVFNAE